MQALLKRLANFDRERDAAEDHSALLRGLKCPTFLLWGQNDTWTPLSWAEQFKSAIPHATLMTLDHVGHIPHEEAVRSSAKAVIGWLLGSAA